MGYRHLIKESVDYFGSKTKYVDIHGARYYDETIEHILTEDERVMKAITELRESKEWEQKQPSLEDLGLRYGGKVDFNLIDWDNWTLERISDELCYVDSFDLYPVKIIKRTYTLLLNGSRGKGEWIVVAASEDAEVLRKMVYSDVDIEEKKASRMWTDKERMIWEDPKGENYYFKIIPTLEVADSRE